MSAAPNEILLHSAPNLFRWEGAKAGLTLFGTYQGTAFVTSHRFIFLSSGEGGLTGQFSVLAGQLGVGETPVSALDLSALSMPGSLDIPRADVESLVVRRRWDFASYLSLACPKHGKGAFAFMSKMGLSRDALERVVQAWESVQATERLASATP